jgi:hypothetical protein
MTQKTLTTWALACALSIGSAAATMAQDSSALIDALVKKKVLSAQEAEDVRADLIKENAQTNAGKLQLGNSITSLKLYGDIRLRYQYDSKEAQTANVAHDNQRSRERIRLRLGADFTLAGGFFGGVGLQTGQSADSANQTVNDYSDSSEGFNNYNIYISKAFFGWSNDYLTLIGGKQANPFYTTDLVWDSDINPVGAVEKFDIIKAIANLNGSSEIQSECPLGLSFVAGQFAYADNTEYATTSGSTSNLDAWLFDTQLIASYKFTPTVKLTVAPGYMTYVTGGLSTPTVKYSETPLTGKDAARDLSVITVPGDISFKVAGIKTKILWDFAYNTQGEDRASEVYKVTSYGHSGRDDIAWLAGIQLGENKKAGDWSILANYRQTGLDAVDPNLADSDFALGYLNMQGIKVGVNYNIADAVVAGITYYDAWNLRSDLVQSTVASVNSVQIVQVDLNIKF